jgi:hypothetical protein
MSSDGEYYLPGCDRTGEHDGREAGACRRQDAALVPGPLDLIHRHPDIPVNVPVRNVLGVPVGDMPASGVTGIVGYDLEMPGFRHPPLTPVRTPYPAAPPTRWAPPPLADAYVRVELDEDDDGRAYFSDWTGPDAEYPTRVFDVPREQYERWVSARDAWYAAQEEMEAVRDERAKALHVPGSWPGREGWVRKGHRSGPREAGRLSR